VPKGPPNRTDPAVPLVGLGRHAVSAEAASVLGIRRFDTGSALSFTRERSLVRKPAASEKDPLDAVVQTVVREAALNRRNCYRLATFGVLSEPETSIFCGNFVKWAILGSNQ
jgi:hypothetical protein